LRKGLVNKERDGKILSGIESLDRIIGGFPEGSVVILLGKPGSGFEIFTLQVLFNRCISEGSAIYMNVDRRMDDIFIDLSSKGWNVGDFIKSGKWKFLDAFSMRMNTARAYGESIGTLIKEYLDGVEKGAWGAIDTFSYFIRTMEEDEVLNLLDDLIGASRDSRSIQFLMVLDGLHDERTLTKISHLVDGVVRFSLSDEVEPVGTMEIKKFRLMEYKPRKLIYRITERGLVIETLSRIA